MHRKYNRADALKFANIIGINFNRELFDLDDLTYGINIELEHGRVMPLTNVSGDDLIITGKIALAHLREFPDYYDRLKKMEVIAEKYWEDKPKFRNTKKKIYFLRK